MNTSPLSFAYFIRLYYYQDDFVLVVPDMVSEILVRRQPFDLIRKRNEGVLLNA
jgi:hypothetical protein